MADVSAAETAPPAESQRPAPQRMADANAQALRESRESVWFLKTIVFQAQPKKIITQNYNGCVRVHGQDFIHTYPEF